MNKLSEIHPLYGDDPTRNGDFGYFLPERKLGNFELQSFFKLAQIPFRYAQWNDRWGTTKVNGLNIPNAVIQPDWCWQNYCAGYAYDIDAGKVFVASICTALRMSEDDVFISCQYGRSSIQFTFTENVEQYILRLLSEAGLI